jgi:hypothetical protein
MSAPSPTRRLLSHLSRLLWGLGALLVLLALVGGVPAVLWLYVGWPLPHALPPLAALARALTQDGIPDAVLINALALGCWQRGRGSPPRSQRKPPLLCEGAPLAASPWPARYRPWPDHWW